jgi:hypothetical protein
MSAATQDTNVHPTIRNSMSADSESTAASKSGNPFSEKKVESEKAVEPEGPATANVIEPETETAGDEATKEKLSTSSEEDDDFEYPGGWKVAVITVALCLSIFCMALSVFPSFVLPLSQCISSNIEA